MLVSDDFAKRPLGWEWTFKHFSSDEATFGTGLIA